MVEPLQVLAEGDCAIRFRRRFAAPRGRVWRAMTDPVLVPRWLWGRDHPMVECVMDPRPGGRIRWVWAVGEGRVGVSGTYRECAPWRSVHTELFDEDWTDGEAVVTTELLEDGAGGTRMEMVTVYRTAAGRARALASQMAEGMDEAYARLDAMLH